LPLVAEEPALAALLLLLRGRRLIIGLEQAAALALNRRLLFVVTVAVVIAIGVAAPIVARLGLRDLVLAARRHARQHHLSILEPTLLDEIEEGLGVLGRQSHAAFRSRLAELLDLVGAVDGVPL